MKKSNPWSMGQSASGFVKSASSQASAGKPSLFQMPFPDHPRLVACVAKELGQGRPPAINQGIAMHAKQHPVLQRGPPTVAACHQSVSCGSAATRRRVRIRELYSHPSQSIHRRSVKLRAVGISRPILIGARVPRAHVIRHEKNDVGRRRFSHGGGGPQRGSEGTGEKQSEHGHQNAGNAPTFRHFAYSRCTCGARPRD